MRNTHTRALSQLWTLSPCLSVAIRFNQRAERDRWDQRFDLYSWAVVSQNHIRTDTHAHTSRQGAYLRKWHHHQPECHWGQGWLETRPITAEITPANGYYTLYEGSLRLQIHRSASAPPQQISSSHTRAGLIAHSITDRWMEQIMERSISVTSYR